MCKAIKNSITAFFLLQTWENAIIKCWCVNTIATICCKVAFQLKKRIYVADASIIGGLSRHHYAPSRGKIEIYGQLESTSWFNSPIFSGMFNNYERVPFYVPCRLNGFLKMNLFTIFPSSLLLTDLNITRSFLVIQEAGKISKILINVTCWSKSTKFNWPDIQLL